MAISTVPQLEVQWAVVPGEAGFVAAPAAASAVSLLDRCRPKTGPAHRHLTIKPIPFPEAARPMVRARGCRGTKSILRPAGLRTPDPR